MKTIAQKMETNTQYTKNQMNNFIDELYYKIARITEGGHYFNNYVDTIKKAESNHRNTWSRDIKNQLTVSQATKYFAVKYIIESKYGKKPDTKDILFLKTELFYGYAIYKEYLSKISRIVNKVTINILDQYDYPAYMSGEKEKERK